MAGEWKLDCLGELSEFIDLKQLPLRFDEILAGRFTGPLVVTIAGENPGNRSICRVVGP